MSRKPTTAERVAALHRQCAADYRAAHANHDSVDHLDLVHGLEVGYDPHAQDLNTLATESAAARLDHDAD
jgi:hypothetical protein